MTQRRKLDAEQASSSVSDEIGVDQRLLRLRYGQFLGEEAEGEPASRRRPATRRTEAEAHEASETDENRHDGRSRGGRGRRTITTPPARRPVRPGKTVLEDYGHTHDHAEAATLLDPETRTTLKAALDQMWQSELNLRQGHPDLALPYAYARSSSSSRCSRRAASIWRGSGPELPPIDESRRLSGERAGLARRGDVLVAADATAPLLAALWRALDEAPPALLASRRLDLDGARALVARERTSRARSAGRDRRDRRRAPRTRLRICRRDLRALLWPLLPRPLANPAPRLRRGSQSARRYLDALRQEAAR